MRHQLPDDDGIAGLQFEWDEAKARYNLGKHGVTFEEAATVFAGPVLREYDVEHGSENRETVIGWTYKTRLVFVVIYEYQAKIIRIISARRATPAEGLRYFSDP